ncbi:15471_t:CDS:2 [Dentiscutata heterogama]|uniref:15471_t:CDS:1 n=1 Tax=Dentiscutata heterogama TaxID=1316150 RepID=A0ACA9K184_9GLOM|nr:15471_t:CDS:2 [Dentiscutata heterogama]
MHLNKSTLEKRARKFGKLINQIFQFQATQFYHKNDQVVLKALEFSVNEHNFRVDFNKEKENYLAIVQAIDQGQISRDAY